MNRASEGSNLRILFAPVMTGHLHLGEARLAVLSWALARYQDGALILLMRSGPSPEAAELLLPDHLDDLRWLGLSWHEGPDVGGPYAPYVDWQREDLYRKQIRLLEQRGLVYRCYCSPEELRAEREEQIRQGKSPRYSGRCRNLARERQPEANRPFRLRLDVNRALEALDQQTAAQLEFEDLDDFVVFEFDGRVAATMRAATDAGLLRADVQLQTWDGLHEARKQAFLMRLLGFEPPRFLFVPPLLGPDGMPLSERHGPVTVRGLREMGYLGKAVRGFLLELEGMGEIARDDSGLDVLAVLQSLSVGPKEGRKFSFEDLREANARWIRQMAPDAFRDLAVDYLRRNGIPLDSPALAEWLGVIQNRIGLLSDLPAEVRPLFEDPDLVGREVRTVLKRASAQKVLWSLYRRLEVIERLTADAMREAMQRVSAETGLLGRELWDPVRLALIGRTEEPKIAHLAELLGKETCERRIRRALEVE